MNLGEFLRKKRLEKGLSLREVARQTNISHVHIGAIERGESATTFDKTYKLLNLYGTTYEELKKETGFCLIQNSFSDPTLNPNVLDLVQELNKLTSEEINEVANVLKKVLSLYMLSHGPKTKVVGL